ncbi:MAG: hypothetical protein QOH26_2163 [Actinomycetota bacterium]|nr:hypothetical protein [Actinomycetota bacterium]
MPPRGNVASCDIRGASPGSRELELLDVARKLTEVHAILLTGGSAFGLAAADGVMSWLEERGIGYETPVNVVPIVPTAVVFDLGSGNPSARPNAESGRAACDSAVENDVPVGRVGAGTGCTVGKLGGFEFSSPGGLGIASATEGDWTASALAVVNAVGDVVDENGKVVAGSTAPSASFDPPPFGNGDMQNTVLAVVAVNAALDKPGAKWLAARGSDGITVSVRPAHTRYDGDVAFAVAAPGPAVGPRDLDVLGFLATKAVAGAVRNAVRPS